MSDLKNIEPLKTGVRFLFCSGCGRSDVPLQGYGLRTTESSRHIFSYCEQCSEEIAEVLTNSWKPKE